MCPIALYDVLLYDIVLCGGFFCVLNEIHNANQPSAITRHPSAHVYSSEAPPNHPKPSEQSIYATTAIMSSTYAHCFPPDALGSLILFQVQKQLDGIKSNTKDHRITAQTYYTLGQKWNDLQMALKATSDAADKAAEALNQQRARATTEYRRFMRNYKLQKAHRDTCLKQFKYVTALSKHAWAAQQLHDNNLLGLTNRLTYYEGALAPQTHIIRRHQTWLDTLGRTIETIKRRQDLKMICIRWIRIKATAKLIRHAKNLRLTCDRDVGLL